MSRDVSWHPHYPILASTSFNGQVNLWTPQTQAVEQEPKIATKGGYPPSVRLRPRGFTRNDSSSEEEESSSNRNNDGSDDEDLSSTIRQM